MEIIFLMISALFIFYISFCIYATFHEKNSSMFGMLGFLSFFGFVLPILLFISGVLNLIFYLISDSNSILLWISIISFCLFASIFIFGFLHTKLEEHQTSKTSKKYFKMLSDYENINDFSFIYENNNRVTLISTLYYENDEKQEFFKNYLINKGFDGRVFFSNNSVSFSLV